MPDRITRAQARKSEEQQDVLQLLGLQRWSTFCGVKLNKMGLSRSKAFAAVTGSSAADVLPGSAPLPSPMRSKCQ